MPLSFIFFVGLVIALLPSLVLIFLILLSFIMQSSPAATCYTKFVGGHYRKQDFCLPCTNYDSIIVKRKLQHQMGYRYRCQRIFTVDETVHSTSSPGVMSPEVSSPPRKCARSSTDDLDDFARTPLIPSTLCTINSELTEAFTVSRVSCSSNNCSLFDRNELVNSLTNQLSNLRAQVQDAEQMLRQKDEEIERIASDLSKAKERLKSKDNRLRYLESPRFQNRSNPGNALDVLFRQLIDNGYPPHEIMQGFTTTIASKKSLQKHFCTSLSTVIDQLPEVKSLCRHVFMKEIKYKFRPWVCLQQLDLCATVSFRAFDIIRKIEFLGDEKQRYRRGLLPSRYTLARLCRQLESYGSEFLPYEINGNSVKFNVSASAKFLFEKFGLNMAFNERCTEPVTLSATVDGGDLAWGLTQVSAGVKIVDPRAINPCTGQPLFGGTGFDKIQSRSHCFPLHIFIAKDNKELYQTHLSQFFREVNDFEVLYPNGIRVVQGADMCSLQKTVCRGGAMKNKKFACYCCDIHRDNLIVPNESPCLDCVRLSRTERCYHREVCDENWRDRLVQERNRLLVAYPYLSRMPYRQRSLLHFSDDAIDIAAVDPHNIDFQPRNYRQKAQFRQLVINEFKLRDIVFDEHDSLDVLKNTIREVLLVEKSFQFSNEVLSETDDARAMIRLEQALPCLLHLENRPAETIIEFVIRRGFLLRHECRREQQSFMKAIEYFMNEKIFGNVGCPSNWRFPLNVDGSMGSIKLANWRARKVIENLQGIIEICLPGVTFEAEREKWIDVVSCFQLTI